MRKKPKTSVTVALEDEDYKWVFNQSKERDCYIAQYLREIIHEDMERKIEQKQKDNWSPKLGVAPIFVDGKNYDLYLNHSLKRNEDISEFVDKACKYFIRCIEQDNAVKEAK